MVFTFIFLFLVIGFVVWMFGWKYFSPIMDFISVQSEENSNETISLETYKVQYRPIKAKLYLSGITEPPKTVHVSTPLAVKIKKIFIQFGDKVHKGQKLIQFENPKLDLKFREVKIALLKAEETLKKLENWEQSNEVSKARNAIFRSKNKLKKLRKKLQNTKLLYERGIISGLEYEAAKENLDEQQTAVQTSEEYLTSVLKKADKKTKSIAGIELENTKIQLEEIKEQLSYKSVSAPISGIITAPDYLEFNDGSELKEGKFLPKGTILFSIVSRDGLLIRSKVDEIDIPKVKIGQSVNVTFEAFNDILLVGHISYISKQAENASGFAPKFDISILVKQISVHWRSKILYGMTAELDITTYSNSAALVVPLSAIYEDEVGKHVNIIDKETGNMRKITVKTGMATENMIEIIEGVKEGTEVIRFNR